MNLYLCILISSLCNYIFLMSHSCRKSPVISLKNIYLHPESLSFMKRCLLSVGRFGI